MRHDQAIAAVEKLLPSLNTATDPGDVLIKYARAEKLTLAQLEKLAHVYNTAKTLNVMQKNADRGASFDLLDPSAVMSRYLDAPATSAMEPVKSGAEMEWIFEDGDKDTEVVKLAAHGFQAPAEDIEDLWGEPADEVVKSAADDQRALEHAFEVATRNLETAEQVAFDALEDARNLYNKVATALVYGDIEDYSDVEHDLARQRDGETALTYSRMFLKGAGLEKEASWDGHKRRNLALPSSEPWLHTLLDAADHMRAAQQAQLVVAEMRKEAESSAAVLDAPFKPAQMRKSEEKTDAWKKKQDELDNTHDYSKREKLKPEVARLKTDQENTVTELQRENRSVFTPKEVPGGDITSFVGDIIKQLEDRNGDTVSRMGDVMEKHVPKIPELMETVRPSTNKKQQQIDTGVLDTRMSAMLQRLMLTDPIISNADPNKVVSLATTLQGNAEDVSRDINLLRFALREGLQYDAVPPHTLDTFSKLQVNRDKHEGAVRDKNTANYDLRGKAPASKKKD
jgi:gas vesicle protein